LTFVLPSRRAELNVAYTPGIVTTPCSLSRNT